eukprot:TRINITY_DN1976_c0_g1_i1.p1 TRINITY_DN1976_c0_g1~~TRINITY_DN1976_c0_g1_i1.p1  ORF type:complete len:648 (-),score=114.40 TRINITY_DN1976_c0_g1_i1:258-2147(-)
MEARRVRPPAGAIRVPYMVPRGTAQAQAPSQIVAIDFGTTRSALAWTIVDESVGQRGLAVSVDVECKYASSQNEPKLFASDKADTILVIDQDTTDTSKDLIGPGAFLRRVEEAQEQPTKGGWYATDFKMMLDVKTLAAAGMRNINVEDSRCTLRALVGEAKKEMPLLEVITRYLRVAGNLGYQEICSAAGKRQKPVPQRSDVTWVITVPAIWTDQSRMFMRKAALDANLIQDKQLFSDRVRICLEPEGAALQCFQNWLKDRPTEAPELKDKKFMVIDLGGGTADITVHQITEWARLVNRLTFDEIEAPSGGPWGGRLISEEFFLRVLQPVLGATLFSKFINNDAVRRRFLYDHFNSVIAGYQPEDGANHILPLVELLVDLQDDGSKLAANVAAYNGQTSADNQIVYNAMRKTLRVPSKVVGSWFLPIVNPVRRHLDTLTAKHGDVKLAFLVGGMGGNQYTYELPKVHLGQRGIALYQPPDTGLAIVKGATRFGRDESAFGGRISRTNYGLQVHNQSNPKEDKFSLLIPKGEKLIEFSARSKREPLGPYSPVTETQTQVAFKLYESDTLPTYTSEPSCSFIASVVVDVDMSVPFSKRKYTVSINMAGTVMEGYFTDTASGQTFRIQWSSR